MTDQAHITSSFRPGTPVSRVGLFGGTFDPVHVGHLHMAEEIKKAFDLEKIIVIPAAAPPHKKWKTVSNPGDRLHMVRLCFEDKDGFQVSDVELQRNGLSFTIDTLNFFISRHYGRIELMMMVGTDAFYEIHTWRRFDDILSLVPLIVTMRPEPDTGNAVFPIERMGRYLKNHVACDYRWDEGKQAFYHDQGQPIYLFKGALWHVSSTDIRKRLHNKEDVTSMLSPKVYDYIVEKGLYS